MAIVMRHVHALCMQRESTECILGGKRLALTTNWKGYVRDEGLVSRERLAG